MWRPRDPTEGRGEQINESGEGNMTDTQKSSTMSPELARITELAKEDKQRKFFSIAHLLTIEALSAAYLSLRTEASAGVDGVTYKQYDVKTWEKIRRGISPLLANIHLHYVLDEWVQDRVK